MSDALKYMHCHRTKECLADYCKCCCGRCTRLRADVIKTLPTNPADDGSQPKGEGSYDCGKCGGPGGTECDACDSCAEAEGGPSAYLGKPTTPSVPGEGEG